MKKNIILSTVAIVVMTVFGFYFLLFSDEEVRFDFFWDDTLKPYVVYEINESCDPLVCKYVKLPENGLMMSHKCKDFTPSEIAQMAEIDHRFE